MWQAEPHLRHQSSQGGEINHTGTLEELDGITSYLWRLQTLKHRVSRLRGQTSPQRDNRVSPVVARDTEDRCRNLLVRCKVERGLKQKVSSSPLEVLKAIRALRIREVVRKSQCELRRRHVAERFRATNNIATATGGLLWSRPQWQLHPSHHLNAPLTTSKSSPNATNCAQNTEL